jgi:hypothetical protein
VISDDVFLIHHFCIARATLLALSRANFIVIIVIIVIIVLLSVIVLP